VTDNVVVLGVVTTLDIPVERVLEGAKDLTKVVLVGYDADGEEYFASSFSDGGEAIWLMERAKLKLLRMADT